MFLSPKGSIGVSYAEKYEDFINASLKTLKVDTNSQY